MHPTSPLPDPSAPADVRAQLDRILSSASFHRSRRLSNFLRFIVEEKLAGRAAALKEYIIGIQVYQRSSSFDPVADTIVRVEARRLRAFLARYYAAEGAADPIRIEVPKGGYEPRFHLLQPPDYGTKSIAVLPFEDFSPGRDQAYFCEGLADEIINALAQLPSIRVASRTSAFAFRSLRSDIRRIGESLQVAIILEGSVRREGAKVRITAQWVDVDSGFHLWSCQYDRELGEVFAVQSEIAAAIAANVRPAFASPAKGQTAISRPALFAIVPQRAASPFALPGSE